MSDDGIEDYGLAYLIDTRKTVIDWKMRIWSEKYCNDEEKI